MSKNKQYISWPALTTKKSDYPKFRKAILREKRNRRTNRKLLENLHHDAKLAKQSDID